MEKNREQEKQFIGGLLKLFDKFGINFYGRLTLYFRKDKKYDEIVELSKDAKINFEKEE